MPSLDTFAIAWTALALVLVPVQLFVAAPYGRHARAGWGPSIPNRIGWVVMEVVSLAVFEALFLSGGIPKTAPMWVFFALWTAHYVHRSLIYPWRTRTSGKTIPLTIVLGAMSFNVVNAGLNGAYLGALGPVYPDAWLRDPRFIAGAALFAAGAGANIWADTKLIALRRGGGRGYAIPHGGLFEFVSCPNLLGEVVQWLGFALMCWNLPALSFAVWTAANLIPRALSHHRWYCAHFADYPRSRRAVVPFLL
ncbi:MAG: DUF1295 domain-containing protein [Rhizomicrobium sp.]